MKTTPFASMYKGCLVTLLLLCSFFGAKAQVLYAEGADLPTVGSPLTLSTISAAGTYTISGTVTTPGDGQDAVNVVVGAGFQITGVTRSVASSSPAFSGFTEFNGDDVFNAGTSAHGGTFPLGAGTYLAWVSGSFAPGNSWSFSITVTAAGSAPTITGNPGNQTVCTPTGTSFSVTASGSPTSYQWQLSTNGGVTFANQGNAGVYSGATTATLTISNSAGLNGNQYRAIAINGFGNSSPSTAATLTVNSSVGTPSFSLGSTSTRCQAGATITYTATASNTTGITYSLDATSISNGCTINSSTGAVTYPAGYLGTAVITASAAGCSGPTTATHTVTTNGTVTTPAFTLGSTSSRCQAAGTVTYLATATNSTSITYSIDASSISNGVTINSSTAVVTYPAGYLGNTTITASAAGCSGPATQIHIATTNGTVTTPAFALGSTSTRCQGAGTVTYSAVANNATSTVYSLDATSLGAGNTINSSTGAVTYVAGWSGASTITATAAGCSGPAVQSHIATTTPTVTVNSFSPATSTRCQGAGTVTYTTTANNSTGLSYSLDATSLGAGCTINSATGLVTYVAGYSGTATITATATGCNGPATKTHVVTITPTVTINAFSPATSTRCQGAGTVTYTTTGNNSTGITYSLDATSLGAGCTINSATGAVTYTAGYTGTATISAIAAGCNGPSAATTHVVTITPTVTVNAFSPATSTRCQGAGTVTYTTTASNSTGITYSLDATSLGAGCTINGATGAVTYTAGYSGTATITASAAGCNGPATTTHVVTITPTVTVNAFSPATSTRCQGAGTVTYTTTANNSTGITYLLDATSLGAGCTINGATGAVTYTAGYSGTATITASAAGCNGPATTTHVVTITPTVTVNAFSPATSTRCQGAGTVTYTTTANNSTGITYLLDATSLGAGCTINGATGAVTYTAGYSGTATITASAAGCNGPATTTHVVTITPTVTVNAFSPATSIRCQGAGTVTYTTTASNSTGITYLLDATSLGAGCTINGATGAVTYAAGYSGTATITASAAGCNGPATTTHVVTITPTVTVNAFSPATSTRCQGAGTVIYTTTANNSTGITYSIDAISLANGVTINSATGAVTYPALRVGPTTITASAAGCNGPATTTHVATTDGTVTAPAFASGSATTRCQGAGTVNYSATANNATGIVYTLDAISLFNGVTINASTGDVTYPAAWSGPSTITATASGCSGPVATIHIASTTPTVGIPTFNLGLNSTRCQGAGTVTYTAGATNTTGITYSLDATSLGAGCSINSATGAVTFAAGYNGLSIITASAAGCNGPKTATHTVNSTTTVGTPSFTLGATSTRCQGISTVTYTATATNASGISYSLDATSLGAGNAINAATGMVTYVAGWSGTSTITASATGCNGPSTSTHTVTITPTVGTPAFTLGATSTRCQGAGAVTYTATATNNTGITYSLDAASLVATNSINSSTGVVTYVAGWSGTSVITASAAGCNGPVTSTHTVTVTPTVGIPAFALGATSTRCQGAGTVTYTATSTNTTGITYTLDATSLGAGNTINASTGAVTYTAAWSGTSTITASAAGCNGPAVSTHTVTISALPVATFTTSPAANICTNTSSTYTTQAGQFNYNWNVPGVAGTDYVITAGGIGTTSNTVTLTWLTAGSKIVTVSYANASGCTPLTAATNTTTVNARPAVTFTTAPGANSCANNDITYTTQGGQSNYIWTVPGTLGVDYTISSGSLATTSNTVTLKWLTTGSKTVSVNYTNSGNCAALTATSNTTTVNALPTVTFTTAPGANLCIGSSTVTYATQSGQSNYLWSVSGTLGVDYTVTAPGLSTTNSNVTITWLTTGSKAVTVNYTNSAGCTALAPTTSNTTVNALPTVSAGSNVSVCAGASTTLTATGATTYSWSPATGLSSTTGASVIATPTTTTTYTVTGTSSGTSLIYSQAFTNGASSPAQGAVWASYIAGLPSSGVTSFIIRGSNDPVGITCTNAGIAQSVANALRTNGSFSGSSNGHTWYVGGCGGGPELSADYGICSCPSPSYCVRPMIGNDNWGGINTATCFGPSQTMEVVFIIGSGGGTCSNTATVTVTVNPRPTVTFSVAPGTASCAGSPVTYTTQAGQSNYAWSVPGTSGVDYTITAGGIGTTSNTVTLIWLTAGSKTVSVNYSNGSGCSAATATSNTTSVSALPVITTQPVDFSMCANNNTSISVVATGANSYQWQESGNGGVTWSNIVVSTVFPSSNSASLGINNPGAGINGFKFRCMVMNNGCPVFTNAVTATVNSPVNVQSHPANAVACVGTNTSFTTIVTGTSFSYQWQVSTGTVFTNLTNTGIYSGVNSSVLLLTGVTMAQTGYTYRCALIDLSCSGVTATGGASLTINPAPAITKKADTVSGCTGNTLMFATVASGQGLTYQWQVNDGSGYTDVTNNTAYDGAKTPTLTLYNVNTTMNVYTYRCIVSGICNPVATTNVYKLDIKPSPVITVQPQSASKYIGDSVTFAITATGAGLTYQWQENAGMGYVNLLDVGMYTGTKTSQLKVGPALTFSMSGYLYRCLIAGTCGTVFTQTDTLTVKKSFNTSVAGITTFNSMVVYPNPVNEGSLTIMFGEMMKGNTHFDVLDKMGRLVKTVDVATLTQGKYATLQVDNLPAGVYTIRVLNETEGFRSMVQFVKQ